MVSDWLYGKELAMYMDSSKIPLPSDDKRWRVVQATMRRHGYKPDALIETLHTTQESFGFLDEESLRYIAAALHVPLSRVYGVATFYQSFTLKPRGTHHTCVVCTGTACHLKGIDEIIAYLESDYGLKSGSTIAEGKISLMAARCLASCGQAPVAVLDGKVVGSLTRERVAKYLDTWMADKS
jgi:bidirectional [NiFe] hydrogenase diaphorase subunit